jgi:hypothetical protein
MMPRANRRFALSQGGGDLLDTHALELAHDPDRPEADIEVIGRPSEAVELLPGGGPVLR